MGRASTLPEQQSDFVTNVVSKFRLLLTVVLEVCHRLVDSVPLVIGEQLAVDLDGQIGSHENLCDLRESYQTVRSMSTHEPSGVILLIHTSTPSLESMLHPLLMACGPTI